MANKGRLTRPDWTNTKAGMRPATADVAVYPVSKENAGTGRGRNLRPMPADINDMSMKSVYNANNLYDGYIRSREGVEWKDAVQKYESNLLLNILHTKKALIQDTYQPMPMTEFKLSERGHTRHIKAQHISDRVVQRSLNDNVLIPKVRPMLIYDNGASLKDKGLSFARKRFEVHLRNAYKEYGGDGYILLMDFSKYYDNVRHKEALEMFAKVLEQDELEFLAKCFEEFAVDVSNMSDAEYAVCMDKLFNTLEYAERPKAKPGTTRKILRKSLGIGNQSAQLTGIYYPHSMDNYCKTVKGIKYYGRYMDDTYIIMQDKKALKRLYEEIKAICCRLGIFINLKKTHIKKLKGWITWLKINYKIKPSGGLIRKVHSDTFRRERRKLKRFHRQYMAGKMAYDHIKKCYDSWRGSYKRYDSGIKLRKLDKYFYELFLGGKKNGRKRY